MDDAADKANRIQVGLLGGVALVHRGQALPLPTSRKTRAIFVYLLLTAAPVRRERLCELFFDIPDDPRAALRWSLTKIRQMLGPHADALVAERETVALNLDRFEVGGGGRRGTSLAARAEYATELPLAGLDLPGLDHYTAWLAAARAVIDKARRLTRRCGGGREPD